MHERIKRELTILQLDQQVTLTKIKRLGDVISEAVTLQKAITQTAKEISKRIDHIALGD